MKVTEHPLPANLRRDIKERAADATLLLRVDPEVQGPESVIVLIDRFLVRWRNGERPELNEDDDLPLMLGSLWGEQLVEALAWQWAALVLHGKKDVTAVATVSPDRSLALYPFHAIKACLEKGAPIAVQRSFELLHGPGLPPLPRGGYANLLQRLTPPNVRR